MNPLNLTMLDLETGRAMAPTDDAGRPDLRGRLRQLSRSGRRRWRPSWLR